MFGLEEKYLKIVKKILQKHLKNQKVYVFGSRSVGNFKQYSDLDLAIEGDVSGVNMTELTNDFKESIIPIDVDIVEINRISKEFFDAIKDDLKIIKSK